MKFFRFPVWVLGWVAVVLCALVILFADQPAVDRLLAMTGMEKILYPNGKNTPILVSVPPGPADSVLVDPQASTLPVRPPAAEPPAELPQDLGGAPDQTGLTEAAPPSKPNTYRLYFLKLSPEGRLEPVGFSRELPAGATPLTSTLKALLQGPTLQDKAQGALSLVPEGTKLLSVRVKEKTALVSFSEEFEHNTSGLEGLAGQLRQIVWTATQFTSVDSVQILINGQYRDTLGDGGISVATPLTRATVP